MAINNTYCESCSHAPVCEWTEKLYKLEGTAKKAGILDLTVNGCDRYLPLNEGNLEEN